MKRYDHIEVNQFSIIIIIIFSHFFPTVVDKEFKIGRFDFFIHI